MTAFNTHTYSVYMPRKRTCTFRLLSLNFQGKYLTFRVQKLIKNEMPFQIYFYLRAIRINWLNRIYILDAAKMEKLPDCKIPTNCIGWYCLHKVPVTDLLKHHYKYVSLRCFYDFMLYALFLQICNTLSSYILFWFMISLQHNKSDW